MEDKIDDNKIRKCLKSYLTAKKYYESDLDKSYEYFKQCIRLLNDLKEKNSYLINNYADIIDETETECSKYLTLAIEKTIEKPLIKRVIPSSNNVELFEIIETGCIEKLKEYKYGQIDFSLYNEQGLTPLHYAIRFGDVSFIKHALKIGACVDQTSKFGHTLLEFACLEKDPNIINFLMLHGADMKKHLKFREGKKYFNNGSQLDIVLLEKMIMEFNSVQNTNINHLSFLFNYINEDEKIEIGYCEHENSTILKKEIRFIELVKKLDNYLDTINEEKRLTFIEIVKEELDYELSFKLGCPTNKLHILLYNLVPFIDYNDNLRLNWLISLEIKYMILKILKNKVKINTKQLKQELTELLYNSYIKQEIVPEGFIQLKVLQWIYKIKV